MIRPLISMIFLVAIASSSYAGMGSVRSREEAKIFALNDAVGQNSITFMSEAPMEKFTGTADKISGSFAMDWQNLEVTSGKISVLVRSMKTAIARRDEHMYSSVWLDADQYPEIVFEISGLNDVSTTVKNGKNVATAMAVGMFSCHGVTKPLSASVTLTYVPENEETKKRAPGDLVMITASFDVVLKDFNITGKIGLIGSSVEEVMHIRASMYANS
ncbi:MAG: YceI family protein [Ignavibacteria bacterium]|nr:YceI family protein [Ignavibacteria bacterium]